MPSALQNSCNMSTFLQGGANNIVVGTLSGNSTMGTFNTCLGYANMSASTGISNKNVSIGYFALSGLTQGQGNIGIGDRAGQGILSSIGNIAIGSQAFQTSISGNGNVGIGYFALQLSNGGENNTSIGNSALLSITTGSTNIGVGYNAGSNYTSSESSNIVIGNSGVIAESNVIRIGTQGTGSGQQSQCHLAGVLNTVSGRVVKVTTPGGYPYTTLTTDYVILVDTSAARTITPLANPVTGTTYRIKDSVGSASTNNITITPSGKNIDGAASYVINTNYQSVDIVYNGTQWNIL